MIKIKQHLKNKWNKKTKYDQYIFLRNTIKLGYNLIIYPMIFLITFVYFTVGLQIFINNQIVNELNPEFLLISIVFNGVFYLAQHQKFELIKLVPRVYFIYILLLGYTVKYSLISAVIPLLGYLIVEYSYNQIQGKIYYKYNTTKAVPISFEKEND